MYRLLLISLALTTGLGCTATEATPSEDTGIVEDSAPLTDSAAVDTAPDAFIPNVCPIPKEIAPGDLPAEYIKVKVDLVRAVDGDTAHFKLPDPLYEQTIRFLYVNTEESGGTGVITEFGKRSKEQTAAYLLAGKSFMIAFRPDPKKPGSYETDIYGRFLGLVFVDGMLLQERLIREGWSPYYTEFGCAKEPVHTAFINAEAEANTNKRGVWEVGHPTDYKAVMTRWIGRDKCRPNPYLAPYCK